MNPEINTGVAVIGPGAIGTTIAAALHEVGRTPLLCGRSPRDHLTLQDGDRFITVPGPIRTNPTQIARTADLVFLAVKATQIEAAAEWLAVLVGPETVVCVLQNGIEQLDGVRPYSPHGQIVPSRRIAPAQGTTRRLGTLAWRSAPQSAGHVSFPRSGRSAARHTVRRRFGRELQLAGLAQADAERGGWPHGTHAPPLRHVRSR